jgi:hypothetical protein
MIKPMKKMMMFDHMIIKPIRKMMFFGHLQEKFATTLCAGYRK